MNRRTPRRTQSMNAAPIGRPAVYNKVQFSISDQKQVDFFLDSMMQVYLVEKKRCEPGQVPKNFMTNLVESYKKKTVLLAHIDRNHVYNHIKKRQNELKKNPSDEFSPLKEEHFRVAVGEMIHPAMK